MIRRKTRHKAYRLRNPIGGGDKEIIRQIVERCHVGDSDEKVFEYVLSRLSKSGREGLTAKQKATLKRAVIAAHRANQKLYSYVMRGRNNPKRRTRRNCACRRRNPHSDKPCFGPGKCEYKTINTETPKGLRVAERLKTQGWFIASVGLFSITFYRKKK